MAKRKANDTAPKAPTRSSSRNKSKVAASVEPPTPVAPPRHKRTAAVVAGRAIIQDSPVPATSSKAKPKLSRKENKAAEEQRLSESMYRLWTLL